MREQQGIEAEKMHKQVAVEFECAEVWIRATQLSTDIYLELIDCQDFDFWDQITQIGHAIASSIAEGRARTAFNDCADHLVSARKACRELLRQIETGQKIEHIEPSIGDQWISETRQITAMLTALVTALLTARNNALQPA
ncbi:S23 ribosomal protein [endosymbiont of Tevnia jerichonana (vent Tica)]|uniref:S23 ribosomal protein n=1 Tax=endosymbiont of Tevnia jerichonana (vent Tica) TaxID=1049564 RepID=G2FI94_9GAMM|nr:S23 ribosomal protein [endosymbiont of Tevnia jerichonana (vent Tica)]